jgi:YVTN family beta-propeller protein
VFSKDGTKLYVSGETAGDVTVIDVAKREVLARYVHGGGDAMGLAMSADGKTLYAAAARTRPCSRSTPRATSPWRPSRCPAWCTRPR